MCLAAATDDGCVACHANLNTKSGKMDTAAKVDGFENHPEFAPVQAAKDPTGIKFNHQKHAGELTQKCVDCHPAADVAKSGPHSHVSTRALMQIPTYAGTCMPCHALTIDDKVADPAPHDKPAAVHQFVADQLAKYIAKHPGDLGKDGTPGSSAAWVKFKIAADEKVLWETTCARCHNMLPGGPDGLPEIAPSKIPARYFAKATFDHSAHQSLTCASCHPGAVTSKVSSDVLLPGVQVCRQCHNSARASAGNNCSTCHVYHDWSKEKGVDGKYMIEHLTRLESPGKTSEIRN